MFNNLPKDFKNDDFNNILIIGERTGCSFAYNDMLDLISKGVVGVLPHWADSSLLKKAIKTVSKGELWIERKTIKNLLNLKHDSEKGYSNLTRQEREVVLMLSHGYRNKVIATKLNITESTVKSHCNRIYKKFGVSDRFQLIANSYKLLSGA
jgi:LuxR family transcriptional regulator of csgAB operon